MVKETPPLSANEKRRLKYATDPEYRARCQEEHRRSAARFRAKHPDHHKVMYLRHIGKRKVYLSENREAILAKKAAYRDANRERLRLENQNIRKSWPFWKKRYKKSLEKALRNKAEVIDRDAIQSFYKRVFTQEMENCEYCKRTLLTLDIIIDHKKAYALGGKHTVPNLAVSCYGCNRRKNARTYAAWEAMIR